MRLAIVCAVAALVTLGTAAWWLSGQSEREFTAARARIEADRAARGGAPFVAPKASPCISARGEIWIGVELYRDANCGGPVGAVREIQPDRTFPDGSRRDAVLIRPANGAPDTWLPRDVATGSLFVRETDPARGH